MQCSRRIAGCGRRPGGAGGRPRGKHALRKGEHAAFESGVYFPTRQQRVPLPPKALAHPDQVWSGEQSRRLPARVWFEREPEATILTEMIRTANSYDQTLTLLHLPGAERVWRELENADDGWEPGRRMGSPPIRNLNRSR